MERLCHGIVRDLEQTLEWWERKGNPTPVVSSVFLGGGTPSLLPEKLLVKLFRDLSKRVEFTQCIEITTEANPENVSSDWVKSLSQTPINRVSLGAQSFHREMLEVLDRRCTPEEVYSAVENLTIGGVENFSLDLIFGVPTQTQEVLDADLRTLVSLGPKHLSYYQLTLKPGHQWYSQLPDEDVSAERYEQGLTFLENNGFQKYEISNFAKPGFCSRHNNVYWSGGNYFGLGPSASSRVFHQGRFQHRKLVSHLDQYLVGVESTWEGTNHFQTVLEAVFLSLRLSSGVSLKGFDQNYEYDLTQSRRFQEFVSEGLLLVNGDVLKLSHRGFLLADYVARELVDETNPKFQYPNM